MAGRALHRHEHVDAAAVAEGDLEPGPAQHRHVGTHARALDHAFDGVVLSRLARDAAGEDELAVDWHLARDHRFHGVQHRREICLLLARPLTHHAFAGEAICRAVDHVARVRVGHGRGRLVHGVADQHQRFVARSCPVGCDQIAHWVVANVAKTHGAQPRLDRRGDERFEQRLVLEQLGLRARHLDERDQQVLRALARNLPLQHRLDVVHRPALGSHMPTPFSSARRYRKWASATSCETRPVVWMRIRSSSRSRPFFTPATSSWISA